MTEAMVPVRRRPCLGATGTGFKSGLVSFSGLGAASRWSMLVAMTVNAEFVAGVGVGHHAEDDVGVLVGFLGDESETS
jgi:hypothetical protein